MRDLQVLSILLLLVVTLAYGDESCNQKALEDAEVFNYIKGQLNNLLPRRAYSSFSHYYYGDHVPWEDLQSFNITSNWVTHSLVKNAAHLKDGFLERVDRKSRKPIEKFQFHSIFRAPANVNNLWVSEVALASAFSVIVMDQLNIALSGGIIEKAGGEHRLYKRKKEIETLRALSNVYEDLYGYVNDTLKQKDEMKAMASMLLEFEAAKVVRCFYEQLEQSNTAMHKTFIENVPKEKFLRFTNKMIEELKKIIKSEKTEILVTKLVVAIKMKLMNVDIDKLTSKLYLVFLRSRSLVLGVKIDKLFSDLNEVHLLIRKGFWQTYTGQWPAMVKFITNFYTHTLASHGFWLRIDTLHHEQLDRAKRFYDDRQKSLSNQMNDDILPFFRSLLQFMVDIREGKKTFVDDFIAELEKIDLNELFEKHLTSLVDVLSRHFLSCYTALHGKPDLDLFAEAVENNPVVEAIKDLIFKDWPKDEVYPKGLDDFLQKLEKAILIILTSSLGSCADPMI